MRIETWHCMEICALPLPCTKFGVPQVWGSCRRRIVSDRVHTDAWPLGAESFSPGNTFPQRRTKEELRFLFTMQKTPVRKLGEEMAILEIIIGYIKHPQALPGPLSEFVSQSTCSLSCTTVKDLKLLEFFSYLICLLTICPCLYHPGRLR